jgi:photosystem II stability/assembly factor-like uncharacterized protein
LLRLFTSSKARARVVGGLAAAVTLVTVAGTAAPARAALSGSDWVARKLPAGYFLDARTPQAPVSCVRHTKFCMALTNDSANVDPRYHMTGEGVLVTTDAGQTWTGYNSLPPAFFRAVAISCFSVSACGVSGVDVHGQPEIVFTTDGGQAWTDPTPASWEDVSWLTTSIDCVAARSCWVAGFDTLIHGGSAPFLMLTKNDGASWKTFTNLPDARPTTPIGTYALNSISCVSARSCVAVGWQAVEDGSIGLTIATENGGSTWTRTVLPSLSQLGGVSCVPGGWLVPTCFASAGGPLTPQGDTAVILVSRDGGLTWATRHVFANGSGGGYNPISCADASHCWAAWSGLPLALTGTASAGASWSQVTSDTGREYGTVSCLSASACVATTDNGFWVTSDDGGLRG